MSLSNNAPQLSLAGQLGESLLALGWHATTVESCTGGCVAAAITAIAGSSQWFDMGFVTYSNAAKSKLVGVDADLIACEGAVSQAVAQAMAQGGLVKAGADIGVSITGIAGPGGGSVEKPVGTVCFAWALKTGPVVSQSMLFKGDREQVRAQAVIYALEGLLEILEKQKKYCINE